MHRTGAHKDCRVLGRPQPLVFKIWNGLAETLYIERDGTPTARSLKDASHGPPRPGTAPRRRRPR